MFNRYDKQLEDAVEAVDVQSVTAILSRLNRGDELPKYLVKMGLWNELWVDWPDDLAVYNNSDVACLADQLPGGVACKKLLLTGQHAYLCEHDIINKRIPMLAYCLKGPVGLNSVYTALLWTMVEDVAHLWEKINDGK